MSWVAGSLAHFVACSRPKEHEPSSSVIESLSLDSLKRDLLLLKGSWGVWAPRLLASDVVEGRVELNCVEWRRTRERYVPIRFSDAVSLISGHRLDRLEVLFFNYGEVESSNGLPYPEHYLTGVEVEPLNGMRCIAFLDGAYLQVPDKREVWAIQESERLLARRDELDAYLRLMRQDALSVAGLVAREDVRVTKIADALRLAQGDKDEIYSCIALIRGMGRSAFAGALHEMVSCLKDSSRNSSLGIAPPNHNMSMAPRDVFEAVGAAIESPGRFEVVGKGDMSTRLRAIRAIALDLLQP